MLRGMSITLDLWQVIASHLGAAVIGGAGTFSWTRLHKWLDDLAALKRDRAAAATYWHRGLTLLHEEIAKARAVAERSKEWSFETARISDLAGPLLAARDALLRDRAPENWPAIHDAMADVQKLIRMGNGLAACGRERNAAAGRILHMEMIAFSRDVLAKVGRVLGPHR